jgi:hypothetical protein
MGIHWEDLEKSLKEEGPVFEQFGMASIPFNVCGTKFGVTN